MRSRRTISIVGCHAEGEVGDVITGGVLDPPGPKTMHAKLVHFRTKDDDLRNLLLNEPRGRPSMATNLVLPPCDPRADVGLLIMESDEYAHMSGSNVICTTTVLLETGMVPMREPVTELTLDTAAGLVGVTAQCEGGKCTSVGFDNVPSFAVALDLPIKVPGLGTIPVDVVWGGMWFVIMSASSLGVEIEYRFAPELVELGEKVKRAAQAAFTPVHPENAEIKGITNAVITAPLQDAPNGDGKESKNATIVSPRRLDRCPCGTGTCARMAVMHARGQLGLGEKFRNQSIIGTEFVSHIRGTTKVGNYDAILPTVQGRGWITGYKQVVLDPTDPFPTGFRVGDQWHLPADP